MQAERFEGDCFLNETTGYMKNPMLALHAGNILQLISRLFDRPLGGSQSMQLQSRQVRKLEP